MSNNTSTQSLIGTDVQKTLIEGYPAAGGGFTEVKVTDTIRVERESAPSPSGWVTVTGRVTASTNPKRIGTVASEMVKVGA